MALPAARPCARCPHAQGHWHEGGSHRTQQTCVSEIDLDINIHVRKLR
jgi:hypothetical protein